MMTCIWPITNWAWVGWRHANHTKCGYMSDEINDKNDDGTNVANAVSPSGEIEVLEDTDGKLVWTCPNCGNTDQSKMNVARRTCGYIGTQFWNQGRTQEIKERVLHL